MGVFRVSSLATREYGPLSNKSRAHRGPAVGRALQSVKVPGSIPAAVEQREICVAFVLSACTLVGVGAWEFSGFPPMRHVNTAHYLIKVLPEGNTRRIYKTPYNGLVLLGDPLRGVKILSHYGRIF